MPVICSHSNKLFDLTDLGDVLVQTLKFLLYPPYFVVERRLLNFGCRKRCRVERVEFIKCGILVNCQGALIREGLWIIFNNLSMLKLELKFFP